MNQNSERIAWGLAIVIIAIVLTTLWLRLGRATQVAVLEDDFFAPASTTPVASTSTATKLTAHIRSGTDVVAIADGLDDGSRFSELLVVTGVAAQLKGKGPYTLFVPRDIAFARLPPGMMNMSAAAKKQFAQYHVVLGRAIDIDEFKNSTMTALSKDILNFSVDEGNVARVDNSIVIAQYKAKNGIVYLIDAPLFPPK